MIDKYYRWLFDLITLRTREEKYHFLTKALYMKKFIWMVPNDDNRAFEGKNLRERFCEENGIEYLIYRVHSDFNESVSMLELMIALAYRCEENMAGQNDSLPMNHWFWKMIENAGLDRFTDDNYYMEGKIIVKEILDKIIERTYRRDGQGGLFPLKYPKKDQRKVELWYQMCSYLVENYYIESFVV